MKIVVIGAGAMGSIYAALFADAGHEVWIRDTWLAHTAAIEKNGLHISGASGDRCLRSIKIAQSDSDYLDTELFIIATKASAVAEAARLISSIPENQAPVLSIQNGLGAGESLSEFINQKKLFIGVAEGFGASVVEPGVVHHTAMKLIRIGSFGSMPQSQLDPLVELWINAGFNAQAYNDIEQLIWEKFICNVAYSAPCTVFNKSVAELLADDHARMVSQQCALEAWHVAQAKKVKLSFDDPIEYITAFGQKVGNAKPSMLLDHLAKRRSEIGAINGMVAVVAKQVGKDAPYNAVVSAIVYSREANW